MTKISINTFVRLFSVLALVLFVSVSLPRSSAAQHEHGQHQAEKSEAAVEESGPEEMNHEAHMNHGAMHGHMNHGTMHEQSGNVLKAQMQDSVQVVQITVGKMGYAPGKIELKKGVPARLLFTRTEEGGCTDNVQIPSFGIQATELPLNEQVTIEFTPTEDGEFTWACSMEMVKGTLLVKS